MPKPTEIRDVPIVEIIASCPGVVLVKVGTVNVIPAANHHWVKVLTAPFELMGGVASLPRLPEQAVQ